ncbi:TatD DNase family protein [Lewinella aquimaris]|uniref:TatD DNase family protein n=1 Tax=Neolewinella aquimaris TaxID=1835722 RepID=A0A840E8X4_9BACT|nr:TatD family hydrolase [Neolewinella aquimaris]MBB4080015.1 TatD DNase family protein [Neolewinella aquimaris]
MLIDTHTHLYSHKFSEDREAMLQRAREAGVRLALMPAIDRSTHEQMLELESRHPDFCRAMIGLHPVSVGADYEEELAEVERRLKERRWVAIGEIGMDLYWDKTFRRQQEDAFLRQCHWAIEYGLPISIHAREALNELLQLIEKIGDKRLRGVFHCFTGDEEQARRALDYGFYLGIGGVATFKNGGLDPVIRAVAKDRIVLETDAPYLAPSPYRGKRNETSYLTHIAKKISDLWELPVKEVADITSANARQLFELDRFAENVLA